MRAARSRKCNACNYSGIESARLILDRSRLTLDQLVATDKWFEMDAHGARNRHSDKEKFPSDLNRPESYEMSERLLKTLRKSGDFQAEYEGSIPFTRSSLFIDLSERVGFHSDKWAALHVVMLAFRSPVSCVS